MVFLKIDSDISGFTLIEVLVAMTIMAISLTIVMGLFSGGLRSKKRAFDYDTAVELAKNKMQEILLVQSCELGTQEGDFHNGYSWEIEVILDEPESTNFKIKSARNYKMLIIKLKILWEHGDKTKIYSISTLKMEEKKAFSRVHPS
jgi:general secretion pathway protein I